MEKIAYLVFDDSPSKDMKMKVDYLVLKKIPAIWFCIEFLEQRPSYAVYAIEKGFIIGNHSYSHKHFSDLSLEQCYQEIEKTDKIIEHI